MQVSFPMCNVIGVEQFTSKKGTRCGVLRWFDLAEGKVYRTMVFGDDCSLLDGIQNGDAVTIELSVQPSRRDDTAEVYLSFVGAKDARIDY